MPWRTEETQTVEFLEDTLAAMDRIADALERGAPLPAGPHADKFLWMAARICMAIARRDEKLRLERENQSAFG